jgi:hypothetical protein
MLTCKLDDFKDPMIREMAVALKIPNASSASKDTLIAEIKKKTPADEVLVFVRWEPKPGWAGAMSIIAIVVAAASALATWWGVIGAFNRSAAEEKARMESDWESTIVHSIIEEESRSRPRGVSFNDIERAYIAKAQAAEGIKLTKTKLQPLELKKVLCGLLAVKLIWQTGEDRYVTVRTTILPSGGGTDLIFATNRGMATIFAELAKGGGRYTVEQFEKVITKEANIKSVEYQIVINTLIAGGEVLRDTNDKLWSQAHPPPPEKLPKEK